jgi:hypothetical protein
VVAGSTATLLSTEIGQQAALDQQVSTLESFGMTITDERYAQMERAMEYASYTSAMTVSAALPLISLAIAGLLFVSFTAGLGGEASFRQVFSVVVHSSAVFVLQQLFVNPLNYVRESLSSPTNLNAFLPMLEEGTFIARLFGLIDLFYIWWIVVLAIGLGVLYRRPTFRIAMALFGTYLAIAVVVAIVIGVLGGA